MRQASHPAEGIASKGLPSEPILAAQSAGKRKSAGGGSRKSTLPIDAVTIAATGAATHLHQRVCDLIDARPSAEAFLEKNGIDYWFGWDRNLRSACEAANVDADEFAAHLMEFPIEPPVAHATTAALPWLLTMLQESDRHATTEIFPDLERADRALDALQPVQRKRLRLLLARIRGSVQIHEKTAAELIAAATSIDKVTSEAMADPSLIRRLRLDHLELAELAKELGAEARYLSTSAEAQPLVTAARQVISALHQHIKISYNFILPRFTSAVQHRPAESEPW